MQTDYQAKVIQLDPTRASTTDRDSSAPEWSEDNSVRTYNSASAVGKLTISAASVKRPHWRPKRALPNSITNHQPRLTHQRPSNPKSFRTLCLLYPICHVAQAADGIRTHDLVLTKDALYRLSYSSVTQKLFPGTHALACRAQFVRKPRRPFLAARHLHQSIP